MKITRPQLLRFAFAIVFGVCFGGLTMWAIEGDDARYFNALSNDAVCVLKLPEGERVAEADFTTTKTIPTFRAAMHSSGSRGRVGISISGRNGLMCSVTISSADSRFSTGRDIPPGTYHVALERQSGRGPAAVAIGAEEPRAYVTGWQMLSRAWVAALVISGGWGGVRRLRGKGGPKDFVLFNHLLIGFMAIFVYLLFHEGGHSFAELIFGRYSFTNSDFWGLRGHPHSGGTGGPQLAKWQYALISGGGIHLPTLVGWVLFAGWISRAGKRARAARPIVNLYFSAIVFILVFASTVAVPACLLGIMSDGDWQRFIRNVPGPMWLVKALLWASVVVSVMILVRVTPEIVRAWKGCWGNQLVGIDG